VAAVTDDLHYRFPPAEAYRLNRCLYALKSDPAFRARYVSAPAAAMDEMGLAADERAALTALDRDALVARGAHPYLVFMAELRLRMERSQTAFELF
jgi:aromatic-ring opening dioxygenase LigAB LigA subunit